MQRTAVRRIHERTTTWYPPSKFPNHFKSDMAEMLKSQTYADVTFVVSGKEFHLHRCILAVTAPAMCGLCPDRDQTISLDDVDEKAFDAVVRNIYLGEFPKSFENADAAMNLLLTANKFECIPLKLFAESSIVDKHLDEANAAHMLLFAHSNSCALLKESAMKMCLKQIDAVRTTEPWKEVMGDNELLGELFYASHQSKLGLSHIERMSVSELRDALQGKHQSVDGSREMLVKRLKECGWTFNGEENVSSSESDGSLSDSESSMDY